MKKKLQLILLFVIAAGIAVSASVLQKAEVKPRKASSDYPVIYGSMLNGTTFRESDLGLYSIPTKLSSDFELIFKGPAANGGGVYRDGIYYAVNYHIDSDTKAIIATVSGYDLNSGREICKIETDHTVLGHLALDPMSNEIYGITFAPELYAYMLAHIEIANNEIKTTRIANLSGLWAAFAIDGNGQFYGISKSDGQVDSQIVADLYRIDRNTGKTTFIGNTRQHPYDNTDATIDPTTGRMFWTISNDDGGKLLEVDLNTGTATEVVAFDGAQQLAGIFIPTPAAQPGAPDICSNISFEFDKGSKTGKMKFDAPSNLFDSETKGSGRLDVIAITNDDQVGYGEAEWGKTCEIDIDMSDYPDGLYNFTVMPINSVGEGPKAFINGIYVGVDSPASTVATLEYDKPAMKISWEPVVSSANGGWFDKDNVTYTVRRPDGTTAAAGLTKTAYQENISEPGALKEYYYTVTAECGAKQSNPAKTNTILLGSMPLPYTSDYAEDGFEYFTIIDGNNDDITWEVNGNNVQCKYSTYLKANDWLITPPFHLEARKPYILDFSAFGEYSNTKECLEVKLGLSNTAAAMTETLLEPTFITQVANNPRQFKLYIVPETTGNYYIGFHGISDPYMYGLSLTDFSLKLSPDADNPGKSTDFTITPDEDGALNAEISFKAPTETIGCTPLTSMTKIELYRGKELIKTFDNPQPGAALKYSDTVTAGGWYEYTVVAYNNKGKGVEVSASAFIGQDVPAAPEQVNIQRTDKTGEVKVSWPAVTKDRNGKPVHGTVTYTAMRVVDGGTEILKQNISETEFTFQPVTTGQNFVQVQVQANSESGTSLFTSSANIPVGTPYAGFNESFSNGTPSRNWGEEKNNEVGEVRWEVYNDDSGMAACDGDNGFLAFYGNQRDLSSMLFSGLISLKDMSNPALSFYVLNNAADNSINNDIIDVSVRVGNDTEWKSIYNKTVNEAVEGQPDWNRVTIPMNLYAGKELQIAFTGTTINYSFFFLDNIQIRELPACDLALARLSAPFSVKNGAEFTAVAKVANYGSQSADSYKVELYKDGTLASTQSGSNLESGQFKEFSFPLSMAPDATEDLNLSAVVTVANDEDTKNNKSSQLAVKPSYSSLPGAKELTPKFKDGGVTLTWKSAKSEVAPGEQITQNFEDGDAFTNKYDDWTFVDVDGSPVNGTRDYQIPGIEYGKTCGSFWVWDTQELPVDGVAAHSGTKFLFSLFRKDDGTVDDWAISPELFGDAQTISFFAKSIERSYPEKIEVYYSTGSTNPANFVKIPDVGGKVPANWTEYKAALPAGAKRFAIRSCATASFMLMIDDVTFAPADPTGGMTLEGYDLYKNRNRLNASPMSGCEYTDKDLVEMESYSYSVVAVYNDGLGKPSNVVSFVYNPAGVEEIGGAEFNVKADGRYIVISGAEGSKVCVAAMNGMLLYNGVPTSTLKLPVAPGIYTVTAGGETFKIYIAK